MIEKNHPVYYFYLLNKLNEAYAVFVLKKPNLIGLILVPKFFNCNNFLLLVWNFKQWCWQKMSTCKNYVYVPSFNQISCII